MPNGMHAALIGAFALASITGTLDVGDSRRLILAVSENWDSGLENGYE
jgi:hypothetical protein